MFKYREKFIEEDCNLLSSTTMMLASRVSESHEEYQRLVASCVADYLRPYKWSVEFLKLIIDEAERTHLE